MKITSTGISITAMAISVIAMVINIATFSRMVTLDCLDRTSAYHAPAALPQSPTTDTSLAYVNHSTPAASMYKLHYLVERSNGAITWVSARHSVDITLDWEGCRRVADTMNQMLEEHALGNSGDFFSGNGTLLKVSCGVGDAEALSIAHSSTSSESYSGGVTGSAQSYTSEAIGGGE